MEPNTCPIWGTPASLAARDRVYWVDSLRAGGRYRLVRDVYDDEFERGRWGNEGRAKITTWLVDQRRFGEDNPLITYEALEAALAARPLRFSEQRERFFRALGKLRPGQNVWFSDKFDGPPNDPLHPQRLLATMGVESFEEGMAIVAMLRDEGFLAIPSGFFAFHAKGFDYLDSLDAGANTRQAFVAMWFGKEMDEAWRLGFAPGIRDAGYHPLRIDGKEHNNKIDDEIVAEIKRSRFLIADFTCGGVVVDGKFEPNPRGGVYYEAGLAHGLGMEVIFTCRADRMDYAHFDTRQFAHIVWQEPADLRTAVYNRIAATLKEAPGAPGRGLGAVDPAQT